MSTFWVTGGLEEGEGEGEGDVEEGREVEGESPEESLQDHVPMGQVWEIDFGSSGFSSKPKKMANFLSKLRPQRTESVKVKTTPSQTSPAAHTGKSPASLIGKREGKSLSPKPSNQKSTPAQAPAKSRTPSSAPAKSSKLAITAGVKRTSLSPAKTPTAQSRASTAKTSTKAAPANSSKKQSDAKLPISTSGKTTNRPMSAPSTVSKSSMKTTTTSRGSRLSLGSPKSLFSKRKTSSDAAPKLAGKGKKAVSATGRRNGDSSSDRIKADSERELESEDDGSGLMIRSPQRSLSLRVAGGRSARGERGRVVEKGRRSDVPKKPRNTFQSSGEFGGDEAGGWASDERGFESSGLSWGRGGRKQRPNVASIQSQQFSPRMQTTPDIDFPISSREASDRKLEDVQRWVHEVTVRTQHHELALDHSELPVINLPGEDQEEEGEEEIGGESGMRAGEGRAVVSPEAASLSCRKVLDLRRWWVYIAWQP